MLPQLQVNLYAIVLCIILAIPLGVIWYGPVFGPTWAKLMDIDYSQQPSGKAFIKPMLSYLFGSILTIFVLAYTIPVWMPSSWMAGQNSELWVYAFNGAMWNWLGFMLPLQLGRVTWEKRSWRLLGANCSFDLTRMFIFSFIITYWR